MTNQLKFVVEAAVEIRGEVARSSDSTLTRESKGLKKKREDMQVTVKSVLICLSL